MRGGTEDAVAVVGRRTRVGRAPTGLALRTRLVEVALAWERRFGVAPAITSAVSEYDAAMLVGHSDDTFSADCVGRTAVSRGADFTHRGVRYQVKANRPSGKPGSFVRMSPHTGPPSILGNDCGQWTCGVAADSGDKWAFVDGPRRCVMASELALASRYHKESAETTSPLLSG